MAKRLKSAEGSSSEMQRRIDELTVQFNSASGDNQRLQAEMARMRTAMQELQDKNDALARENKQLSGTLRLVRQKSLFMHSPVICPGGYSWLCVSVCASVRDNYISGMRGRI